MGPNWKKMSDDDLWAKLSELQGKYAYAASFMRSPMLFHQLSAVIDEINFELTDRMERKRVEEILGDEMVEITGGVKEKKKLDRAENQKSKNEFLSRMRRSKTPSNIKDI